MQQAGIDRAHLCGNSLGGRLTLMCADMAPDRVISALLVDPAGIEPREMLFEFRIATLPFLGELLTRPTYLGTKMLWRKAFYNPTPFVTDELIEKKLELASLPGAQAAFLKTLRGFVEFRGFRPGRWQSCAHRCRIFTLRVLLCGERTTNLYRHPMLRS